MLDEATSGRRAIQALMEELLATNSFISEALVREIYDIEERVQFLDDRGPIPERIAKLIQAELDQEDVE